MQEKMEMSNLSDEGLLTCPIKPYFIHDATRLGVVGFSRLDKGKVQMRCIEDGDFAVT
jgi:hypothetical protein